MTEAYNQRPEITDSVMSAADLKTNFLFGVSIKDDDGNALPATAYDFYIRSATEWLQNELDIVILPTSIVNEAHDYYLHDLMNYGALRVLRRPVRAVTGYRMQFPLTQSFIEFDEKWFRPEANAGTIHLIPGSGVVEQFLLTQGVAGYLGFYGGDSHVPLSVFVDYDCGFAPGKIPTNILEVIGMKASMGPLNIAGDLIAGAGIASKSLSIDGLSESISTTSSATNAGYGARILQYTKEIESRLATLRGIYGSALRMVIA